MTTRVDVRLIMPRERHPLLFSTFDELPAGAAMELVNDHDPLPLRDQLAARYGDAVAITYRQREPGAIMIDFVRTG